MSDQCFSIQVPNTDVTIQGGSGAVSGISMTTGANVFEYAGAELILESAADMRAVTSGALGAVSAVGILIGTPATIQHSAGGGIQIYAGAGVSASPGGPAGPGSGFEASAAPKTGAGEACDKLNAFNDAVKGASDVYSGVTGAMAATDNLGKAAAAFGAAKGGWDAVKGGAGTVGYKPEKGSGTETAMAGVDEVFKYGGIGMGAVGAYDKFTGAVSGSPTDNVAGVGGALGLVAGVAGIVRGEINKDSQADVKANYDAKLAAGQAAAAARMVCPAPPGASIVPPADGARIHEVAPANIDREAGGDMTAKVGGNQDTKVDNNISTKAGGSISMKAFSAISTSSMTFSAHANVSASMKGLALAKVESLGLASLSGKAKFSVSSSGSGSVKAPKVTIEGTGTLDLKSAATTIGVGPLTINCVTTVTKDTTIKGKTEQVGAVEMKDKLRVQGTTTLKKPLLVTSHAKITKTLKVGDSCKLG